MKMLKSFLLLNVALTLLPASFAVENPEMVQLQQQGMVPEVQKLEKMDPIVVDPNQVSASEGQVLPQETQHFQSMSEVPAASESKVPVAVVGPNHAQQEIVPEQVVVPVLPQEPAQLPVVAEEVKPVEIDPNLQPTLSAEQRVEELIAKKEREEAAHEGMMMSHELPAHADAMESSEEAMKIRLLEKQLEEERAAKEEAQMMSSHDELQPAVHADAMENSEEAMKIKLLEKQLEEERALNGSVTEELPVVMPVSKKAKGKKQKLTPEQIAIMKAGGPEKEALIAELKAGGEEKRLARAKAKEEAEMQAKLLEEEIAQEKALEEEKAIAEEEPAPVPMKATDQERPYAILYFRNGSEVDLDAVIKAGGVNKKEMEPVTIVVDPKQSAHAQGKEEGAVIVEGTVDGREVDPVQELKAAEQTQQSTDVKKDHEEKDPTSVTENHGEEAAAVATN